MSSKFGLRSWKLSSYWCQLSSLIIGDIDWKLQLHASGGSLCLSQGVCKLKLSRKKVCTILRVMCFLTDILPSYWMVTKFTPLQYYLPWPFQQNQKDLLKAVI